MAAIPKMTSSLDSICNHGSMYNNIERQTGKFLHHIRGYVDFFLPVKFATSLLTSLAGGLEKQD